MTSLLVALALSATGAASGSDNTRCGGYCLYAALAALDRPMERYADLERMLGPPPKEGYSLAQLATAAKSHGIESLPVRTSLENLSRRPGRFACIALLDGNHFVLLSAVRADGAVQVVDPLKSDVVLPPETLKSRWDGTALLVSASPLLREEDLPRSFDWRIGVVAAVACGVVLAFLFQWRRIVAFAK